jgi:hypothetical protein
MSEDQNLNLNNQKSTSIYGHQHKKEVKEKMVNFFHPCYSPLYHSVITITTIKDGYDINNFTLLFNLFPTSSELTFIIQPDSKSQWKSRR